MEINSLRKSMCYGHSSKRNSRENELLKKASSLRCISAVSRRKKDGRGELTLQAALKYALPIEWGKARELRLGPLKQNSL